MGRGVEGWGEKETKRKKERKKERKSSTQPIPNLQPPPPPPLSPPPTQARLKEDLRSRTQTTGVHAAYLRAETDAKLESKRRQYSQKEKELRDDCEHLEKKKAMENKVHMTTIAFLKRKQRTLTTEGEKWERKLLDDVAGKDAELEGAK